MLLNSTPSDPLPLATKRTRQDNALTGLHQKADSSPGRDSCPGTDADQKRSSSFFRMLSCFKRLSRPGQHTTESFRAIALKRFFCLTRQPKQQPGSAYSRALLYLSGITTATAHNETPLHLRENSQQHSEQQLTISTALHSLAELTRRSGMLLPSLFLILSLGASPAIALDPGALPEGGVVISGAASTSTQDAHMQIDQATDTLGMNFNTFNIGSAASVNLSQPGVNSVAKNTDTDVGEGSNVPDGSNSILISMSGNNLLQVSVSELTLSTEIVNHGAATSARGDAVLVSPRSRDNLLSDLTRNPGSVAATRLENRGGVIRLIADDT